MTPWPRSARKKITCPLRQKTSPRKFLSPCGPPPARDCFPGPGGKPAVKIRTVAPPSGKGRAASRLRAFPPLRPMVRQPGRPLQFAGLLTGPPLEIPEARE